MTAPPTSLTDTIVVALDGSPAAASALPVARALASRLSARIEILQVLPHLPHEAGTLCRTPDIAGCADYHVRVCIGDPAAEILRAGDDPSVALVVMATHGGEIAGRPGLGHVAERVTAGITRPVLLVHPEAAREAVAVLRAGCLLVPLDGTPATTRALGRVVDLARRLGASLDLLIVASGEETREAEVGVIALPQFVDQPQHAWPEWQRDVVEQFSIATDRCPVGLPMQVLAVAGPVPAAILRFAREHREGIVALVRRSHLEAGHGRTLREVLARATCPVLVVGAEPVCDHRRPRLHLIRPARCSNGARSWQGGQRSSMPGCSEGVPSTSAPGRSRS